jgi:hypothetical protein
MSILPERSASRRSPVQPTRFGQVFSWRNRCHLGHILDGAIRQVVPLAQVVYDRFVFR